jgi:hypothetical protein
MPARIPGVRATRAGEPELSADSPFRYRELEQLQLDRLREPEADGILAFDLRPFIAHAVLDGFSSEGRQLPYHWDFEQTDRFILEIAFAQPVEVMDLAQLQGVWESPSARYTLRATRIDARHVRVESFLQVSDETEHPEDALALETLLGEVLAPSRVLRVRLNKAPEQ